ncbi:MAG: spermidine/putrescine ABC transporter substrate-binding protein, partial [Methanobacteriota archaeon]
MKKKMLIGLISTGLMLVLSFSGCLFSSGPEKKSLSDELNIFNWDDYFGETTLEDFEERFGVNINLYTFEDESFMISSLETNPSLYDIVITSGSYVKELIQTKSLAKLNKDNIPNLQNIAPRFLNRSNDPGNIYSVPYLWGTTGIAVNTSAVTDEVTSWSILWNDNYTGRISMLNNKEEVIATALKYLGYPINPENIPQLEEAEEILLQQKPLLTGYEDPISIRDKLISGEIALAHCYSGDALFAADINGNISYVIPDEGAPLWIDNIVIPVDSVHKYTAEIFINY